ncbi:YihY/virulence factor BrkB family protein [Haloplanus rubicundus]|uniref:YihY/virulence factor BrkB family protein n=1 Tax=Haloplanus rubicundus TaxID=1547898 RepID=A0A345E891_9EURY|nr:YihY/virulence factor BrkB family protein [Haloplanus rubicundus]AXG08413.1 YihY/virulence factor BrkB family protein [Haloplanus rubicundus]
MDRFRESIMFVRVVWRRIREENVTFMAGSIAYQAFISLVPLLVLTLFVLSVVGKEQFAARLTTTLDAALAPNVAPIVSAAFQLNPTAGTSIVGMITLLWGSFRVFRGLDMAFSEIYGTQQETTLISQILDGAVALISLIGALFAMTLATTIFVALNVPYIGVVTPLLLFAGLLIAFFPMYWRFPNTDISIGETVPGVFVAAVGWAILQAVFETYVVFVGRLDTASLLGAILLLLLWLYLGSFLLLVGAVVNAVVASVRSPTSAISSNTSSDRVP